MAWRSAAAFLAALLFASAAWGQQRGLSTPAPDSAHSPLPPVVPSNRPSVGLALEGGGALGLVHIGVLQWLEEHHVPVDRMSGTSMGALIGALYATGRTPAELRDLALSSSISSVFTLQTPYADASYRRREDRREIPQILSIGLRNRYGLRNALLTDRGVNEFLSREFFRYNGQNLDYDQLPIPFRCVATDLNTLHAVSFANGPLTQAIRASISIPGVFPPVQGRDGHYLVDGGILDNLPTGVLRHELHAEAVIAVRLTDGPLLGVDTGSIVAVLNRAFSAGIARNVEQSEALADVVIQAKVGGFSATDYSKAAQLIEAGYKAAEQNRAALMRYSLDDPGWQAYLSARNARQQPPPGMLRQVNVAGGEPGAIREVQRDMKPAEGKPASSQAILSGLKGVQADGVYAATYEMLAQPAEAAGDAGILVHLRKDPNGPPYLLVGPELAASTSNISQGEVDLRLIDQNLGGYGSELRAGARIGYLTDLSAEYYRLLSPSGYFVQPQTRILREPVYIWANQKRIAERFQQNLEAGLEAGRTVNNHVQIAAQWRAMDTRWSLRTGSDGGSYLSGTAQTGLLRITMDESSAGSISPSGFRISAAAGAFYHAMGSDNAPLVRFSFSGTRPWRQNNILGVGGEINSYLRARVAEPFRFTLGGPMRLSASSFDEYRGTDTYLARTGYMHRIAPMPTGMGQGLYAILGYEAGEIWSPDAKAILRQDGTTGLVAATPLGVVTFGVSVGDAGRRKVFFSIGRWF
ncbi:MAG: patatin-like phospholipase family protein [Acidobacteriota bacterium]|nr:patatin-like phospholipase family protein [Acidobacteriota bacterium]